jgi:hypothetical protein
MWIIKLGKEGDWRFLTFFFFLKREEKECGCLYITYLEAFIIIIAVLLSQAE